MVTIIIFWSAVFCILFFLLEAICKGLDALFHAIIVSTGVVIFGVGLSGLAALTLFLIYAIIDGFANGGTSSALYYILLFVVDIVFMVVFFGWLGYAILSLVGNLAGLIYYIVSSVLEGAAGLLEKGYDHFLLVIMKRLDKC